MGQFYKGVGDWTVGNELDRLRRGLVVDKAGNAEDPGQVAAGRIACCGEGQAQVDVL